MICNICEPTKSFKQIDNLDKHYERYHPDEEKECVRCNKLRNICDHNLLYRDYCNKCEGKIQCEICKKYY